MLYYNSGQWKNAKTKLFSFQRHFFAILSEPLSQKQGSFETAFGCWVNRERHGKFFFLLPHFPPHAYDLFLALALHRTLKQTFFPQDFTHFLFHRAL